MSEYGTYKPVLSDICIMMFCAGIWNVTLLCVF